MTATNTPQDIQVGDFVRSKLSNFTCGIVTTVGSIKYGKGKIVTYRITLASGKEDYITEDDIELIAR